MITRDGRDAAISALHFRQVTKERGAPFRDDSGSFRKWYRRKTKEAC